MIRTYQDNIGINRAKGINKMQNACLSCLDIAGSIGSRVQYSKNTPEISNSSVTQVKKCNEIEKASK